MQVALRAIELLSLLCRSGFTRGVQQAGGEKGGREGGGERGGERSVSIRPRMPACVSKGACECLDVCIAVLRRPQQQVRP
jgi:hypothetical protein